MQASACGVVRDGLGVVRAGLGVVGFDVLVGKGTCDFGDNALGTASAVWVGVTTEVGACAGEDVEDGVAVVRAGATVPTDVEDEALGNEPALADILDFVAK